MKHTYTVSGTFIFPIDMLRYDQAWLASQADAGEVEASIGGPSSQKRTVRLVGCQVPNLDRWASFGWAVTGIEKVGK